METVPEGQILEFSPDTLEAVRKEVNLDSRSVNEAVKLLQDWLEKQAHFVKKDFSREYLEITLVTSKGSVERSKMRLDKLCTFKTLMPDFFTISDAKEFEALKIYIDIAVIPKMITNYCRLAVVKLKDDNFTSNDLFQFYKYLILNAEYMKKHDYTGGYIGVLDCRDMNPLNIISTIDLVELRKCVTIMIEGYGLRIKGLHFITASKLIDGLITILKQVLSTKIGGRIMVHKDLKGAFKYVPQKFFPVEFGGEERALKQLHEKWLKILGSEENMKYYKEMQDAATIESCRAENNFNEHYMGMPGSFRSLTMD